MPLRRKRPRDRRRNPREIGEADVSDDRRKTLQDRLADLRERHGVPGASLAVLHDDDVRTAASGILNLDTGVEATTDSLFQIGSITKVWTATLAMQLVDEGLLDLDVPIRTYLPDFRVADEGTSKAVTTRHLLTHTSGIDGDHFADTGRGDDVLERYVASCASLRCVLPLGATMSYCNTGFAILGRIVEVLRGSTWDAALQSHLVEPLELGHTATLPEDVLRFRAAIGHIQPPGHDLTAGAGLGAAALFRSGGCHLRDRGGRRRLRAAPSRRRQGVRWPAGRERRLGAGDAHVARRRSERRERALRGPLGPRLGASTTGAGAPSSGTTAARSGSTRSFASSPTRVSRSRC